MLVTATFYHATCSGFRGRSKDTGERGLVSVVSTFGRVYEKYSRARVQVSRGGELREKKMLGGERQRKKEEDGKGIKVKPYSNREDAIGTILFPRLFDIATRVAVAASIRAE